MIGADRRTLGRAFDAYSFYKYREEDILRSFVQGKGVPKYESWLYEYYKDPYLILESDKVILDRYTDLMSNLADISTDCKIVPDPGMQNDAKLMRMFGDIIQETNWRQLLSSDLPAAIANPISLYFSDGEPVGCRMFGNLHYPPGQCLVKYTQREFAEEMLRFGRFRISPASEYSRGSYIKAIKDLETSRPYKIRALSDALKGKRTVEVRGNKLKIKNGVISLSLEIDDYYLFSTCKEIDRRMPTDFNSDAALVIRNKAEFIHRMRSALADKFTDWHFSEGDVFYYDPYNDMPRGQNFEFWKHFSYTYQKEHRCVLRPAKRHREKMAPFFIEIGSLEDISELVLRT